MENNVIKNNAKKILVTACAFAMILGITAVLPQQTDINITEICAGAENKEDLYKYEENSDGTIKIIKYSGEEKTIIIPDEIDGIKVTGIGEWAFDQSPNLESVTVGENITQISSRAFQDCKSLRMIDVNIQNPCYSSYGGVLFDKNQTRLICCPMNIKTDAYNISDSVTEIADNAFLNCVNLKAVNVGNDNASYSSENGVLFNKDKTRLILCPISADMQEYTVPNSVEIIDADAFDGNKNLTKIIISNNVSDIETGAFKNCENLVGILVSDKNETYSSRNGVLYNKNQTEIIAAPNALAVCVIPGTIEEIGKDVFKECTQLESISADPDNPNYSSEEGILYNKNKTSIVKVPAKVKQYTIPDTVKIIEDGAFYKCRNLSLMDIPDTVEGIGSFAFYGCKQLYEVNIGEGVEVIENGTFSGCSNLTVVNLGSQVTDIGWSAFEGCISLESIELPESVNNIEKSAFYNCTSLNSISLGNVRNIGMLSFNNCNSLKNVTVPKNTKYLKTYSLGYSYNVQTEDYNKISGFKIYCYANSSGEQYAKDNGFNYEIISEPEISDEIEISDSILTSLRNYYLGNVDGNDRIETSDSLCILQFVVLLNELTPEQKAAADVDKNGNVDVDDALTILRYIVGLIDEF